MLCSFAIRLRILKDGDSAVDEDHVSYAYVIHEADIDLFYDILNFNEREAGGLVDAHYLDGYGLVGAGDAVSL